MVNIAFSENDFKLVLNEFGRLVSHTSVTQSVDNISGGERLIENSAVDITAYFMVTKQKWLFDKQGNIQGGDAVLLSKAADNVLKDSIITADGIKYRVKDLIKVPGTFDPTGSGTEYVYFSCNLFLCE